MTHPSQIKSKWCTDYRNLKLNELYWYDKQNRRDLVDWLPTYYQMIPVAGSEYTSLPICTAHDA